LKKSNSQSRGLTVETLASYQGQCAAIAADWARLREIIDTCASPGVNREQLEWDLIAIKSRLACDYPVLTEWRKGGYGLCAGINKMLSGVTNLGSLADAGGNPESRVNRTWREVQASLHKVAEALRVAQGQMAAGRPAFLPDELICQDTHHPFPVKKVLAGLGLAAAIAVLLAGAYVMRNFLGFWAPGAGEGLVVDASMTDEDKIRSVLTIMGEAFRTDSVDLFMTLIADDFKDEKGNGKTALRIALQAYREKGDFKHVTVDWSRMELLERDGFVYARPIHLTTSDSAFAIHLGFKPYRGKLLIATGSAP